MTDKKKNDNTISPVAAGVAGAVIGAGVAIAGAVVLSDDKNKKKVKDTINTLKDKGADYVESMQKEASDKKEEVIDKADSKKTEIEKEASEQAHAAA